MFVCLACADVALLFAVLAGKSSGMCVPPAAADTAGKVLCQHGEQSIYQHIQLAHVTCQGQCTCCVAAARGEVAVVQGAGCRPGVAGAGLADVILPLRGRRRDEAGGNRRLHRDPQRVEAHLRM